MYLIKAIELAFNNNAFQRFQYLKQNFTEVQAFQTKVSKLFASLTLNS